MITVNDSRVTVTHFPDGTQCLKFPVDALWSGLNDMPIMISWYYDSDEELFTLACVVDWVRRSRGSKKIIKLDMPYVPNARMDRIKNPNENFSLKVFANFINSLGFDGVHVYNVHSNVSEALINNIYNEMPNGDVNYCINGYNAENLSLECKGLNNDATGISSVDEVQAKEDSEIYDLTGRRLDHEPAQGLYIKDGRKMLKR